MTSKILKLVLTFSILLFIGCTVEEGNGDVLENYSEQSTSRNIDVDTYYDTNSTERVGNIGGQAGMGDLVYYRVSFYNTTSTAIENMVNQNFRSATTYISSFHSTAEAHTFVWIFFDDDLTTVDSFIANNGSNIEESVKPSVYNIIYDVSLTNTDKNIIKSEFNILLTTSNVNNQDYWVFRDCCLNGTPITRFNDPLYPYYGLVSAIKKQN